MQSLQTLHKRTPSNVWRRWSPMRSGHPKLVLRLRRRRTRRLRSGRRNHPVHCPECFAIEGQVSGATLAFETRPSTLRQAQGRLRSSLRSGRRYAIRNTQYVSHETLPLPFSPPPSVVARKRTLASPTRTLPARPILSPHGMCVWHCQFSRFRAVPSSDRLDCHLSRLDSIPV